MITGMSDSSYTSCQFIGADVALALPFYSYATGVLSELRAMSHQIATTVVLCVMCSHDSLTDSAVWQAWSGDNCVAILFPNLSWLAQDCHIF